MRNKEKEVLLKNENKNKMSSFEIKNKKHFVTQILKFELRIIKKTKKEKEEQHACNLAHVN